MFLHHLIFVCFYILLPIFLLTASYIACSFSTLCLWRLCLTFYTFHLTILILTFIPNHLSLMRIACSNLLSEYNQNISRQQRLWQFQGTCHFRASWRSFHYWIISTSNVYRNMRFLLLVWINVWSTKLAPLLLVVCLSRLDFLSGFSWAHRFTLLFYLILKSYLQLDLNIRTYFIFKFHFLYLSLTLLIRRLTNSHTSLIQLKISFFLTPCQYWTVTFFYSERKLS